MKKYLFIAYLIIMTSLTLNCESIAPLIFFNNQDFTVEYIEAVNDSIFNFQQKVLSNQDSITLNIQNNNFVIPLNNEFITPIDSINTNEDIIILSDIEGNFNALYSLLYNNKIIDKTGNWIFEKGHLILAGDMVDRGEFVDETLLLLYKLDYQAFNNGGRVHYLLGNHDIMLIKGDLRYTHKKYHSLANAKNTSVDNLYNKDSLLGKWIRSKHSILKINDFLVVHAGISKELINNNYSLNEINQLVLQYNNDNPINDRINFLLKSYGPFWFRGMMRDYKDIPKLTQNDFTKILTYFNANKIIVGHTVVDNISYSYQQKLIGVDVNHYENSQGLLIKNNKLYIIYPDKEKTVLN
ncbi:MAG: metallophosphoesterase [Candidatus Cloacimonetes bacterium]|nr:metallophosphoesterase [Candidatus Cloacimonadota bacterium]